MRALLCFFLCGLPAATAVSFEVQLDTILTHDDGAFLWFHPRAAAVPGAGDDGAPLVVLTLQQHLKISDYYGPLHYMLSRDLGKTWTEPMQPPALAWGEEPGGVVVGVCDVTPVWHAPSGKVIAVGVKLRYKDGQQLLDQPRSQDAAYAVYDPEADTWSPWRLIGWDDPEGEFFRVTPGCVQFLVEPDGSLLIPFYFRGPEEAPHTVTVMHASFDGETISYIEHGEVLALEDERGLVEPSLAKLGDTYYMTIRNDLRGYVTRSTDGLRWEAIRPWTFDDGEELGSYNTQQHWLTHGDKLYLSYTRRGADNDHIMRHRAPLFMAEVDPVALHVLRDTEQVLIPERGATLGNFGAGPITETESWVTVSEGIWSDEARERGAEGATFAARVLWAEATALNVPDPSKTKNSSEETPMEKILFGAGCFWGVEAAFQQLPGVQQATSGYAGGHTEDPSYEEVCSGATGHAEVVEVVFNPEEISVSDLLDAFWQIHDPTTLNRQGPDVGSQYRSAIFCTTPEQQAAAEDSKARWAEKFPQPIVTEIGTGQTFYRAEEYHQEYYARRGIAPTCHVVLNK